MWRTSPTFKVVGPHIDWYLSLQNFSACDCSSSGASSTSCTSSGVCTCKSNFSGTKCTSCNSSYYGYPNCNCKSLIYYWNVFLINEIFNIDKISLACNCDVSGSSSTSCSSSGVCSCKTGYTGEKCSSCLPGYHKAGSECYCKSYEICN